MSLAKTCTSNCSPGPTATSCWNCSGSFVNFGYWTKSWFDPRADIWTALSVKCKTFSQIIDWENSVSPPTFKQLSHTPSSSQVLPCPILECDDTTADLLGLEQGLAVAELSHSQVQAQEACPPLKGGCCSTQSRYVLLIIGRPPKFGVLQELQNFVNTQFLCKCWKNIQ